MTWFSSKWCFPAVQQTKYDMVIHGNIFFKRTHIQKLISYTYAGLETLALFYRSVNILCSLKKTWKDWKTVVWKLWEDEGGIKVSLPQCQITQCSEWPCRLSVSVHRQTPLRETRTQDHPDTRLKQQFVFHQSWHRDFEVKFHKSITHTVQFMCDLLSGNVCSCCTGQSS